MLEAALLILSSISNHPTIEYSISGHSGDSANIDFVPFNAPNTAQEKFQFQVLQVQYILLFFIFFSFVSIFNYLFYY